MPDVCPIERPAWVAKGYPGAVAGDRNLATFPQVRAGFRGSETYRGDRISSPAHAPRTTFKIAAGSWTPGTGSLDRDSGSQHARHHPNAHPAGSRRRVRPSVLTDPGLATGRATPEPRAPLRTKAGYPSVTAEVPRTVGPLPYCHRMSSNSTDRAALATLLTTYKTALYSALVALVGVVILWWVTDAHWFDEHTTAKAVCEQIGGLLITTGGLALLWDLRGKREIIQEVLAKTGVGTDIATTGIKHASMDWRVVPWTDLIKRSREIDVFIAYGSTWLSTHSTELTEFAKDRRNKLRYILPDPDDSLAMSVLAERFEYTQEIIASKVRESASAVAKISRAGNADIRVWYRSGAPTYTCYRFDDTVVVTLYRHEIGRGAIPTLMLKEGTFQDFFVAELDAVVSQGREVGLTELLGDANAS